MVELCDELEHNLSVSPSFAFTGGPTAEGLSVQGCRSKTAKMEIPESILAGASGCSPCRLLAYSRPRVAP